MGCPNNWQQRPRRKRPSGVAAILLLLVRTAASRHRFAPFKQHLIGPRCDAAHQSQNGGNSEKGPRITHSCHATNIANSRSFANDEEGFPIPIATARPFCADKVKLDNERQRPVRRNEDGQLAAAQSFAPEFCLVVLADEMEIATNSFASLSSQGCSKVGPGHSKPETRRPKSERNLKAEARIDSHPDRAAANRIRPCSEFGFPHESHE